MENETWQKEGHGVTDEIKIWAVKKDASSATPVPSADQTDKGKMA